MTLLSASFAKAVAAERKRVLQRIGSLEAELDEKRDELEDLRAAEYLLALVEGEEFER